LREGTIQGFDDIKVDASKVKGQKLVTIGKASDIFYQFMACSTGRGHFNDLAMAAYSRGLDAF